MSWFGLFMRFLSVAWLVFAVVNVVVGDDYLKACLAMLVAIWALLSARDSDET